MEGAGLMASWLAFSLERISRSEFGYDTGHTFELARRMFGWRVKR
jgi:hypothetical protein